MNKSWKTTVIGAITAAFIAVEPIVETGQVDWKKVALGAAVAAFGYLAKDANVTGGTTPTDPK